MPKTLMRVRLRRGMRLRRRFFGWRTVGSCFPVHSKHPDAIRLSAGLVSHTCSPAMADAVLTLGELCR